MENDEALTTMTTRIHRKSRFPPYLLISRPIWLRQKRPSTLGVAVWLGIKGAKKRSGCFRRACQTRQKWPQSSVFERWSRERTFSKGHTKLHSIIDLGELSKEVFSSGKRFVLHCASGWRSALATKQLQDMGAHQFTLVEKVATTILPAKKLEGMFPVV